MGFRPAPSPWLGNAATEALARDRLAECARVAMTLAGSLPAHRELLSRIQRYGLQKI
jgi:hypothetical protein